MKGANPPAWPQHRAFPEEFSASVPQLRRAWDYSRTRIEEIRQHILAEPIPTGIATIAVSGSLSRMEAHGASDVDLLIVINDREAQPGRPAPAIHQMIWERLSENAGCAPIRRPKADGIFSECVSWRALTETTSRGRIDESMTVYGHRMQLLLDAQPLIGSSEFDELRLSILEWYSETRIADSYGEFSQFHWLWQDVLRYWRSIRSRACWLHADNPVKSAEVNLKLRSSRLVLIAAFLQALESTRSTVSADAEKFRALNESLRATPLERIVGDLRNPDLLTNYEYVWSRIISLTEDNCEIDDDDRDELQQLRRHLVQLPRIPEDWLF